MKEELLEFIQKECILGKDRILLLCVTKRNDIMKIKELVLEKDKNAFIIISDAREVYGLGFKIKK